MSLIFNLRILQNLESSAGLLLVDGRPINRLAIGTNTRDVQLKLAGDGLLVVDNPEGLVLSDLDAIDLTKNNKFS